jgi:hypothetical protein
LRMIVLSFFISFSISHSLYFDVRSIPEDGSSNKISLDPAINEIATESLLFVPPDKFCEYTS